MRRVLFVSDRALIVTAEKFDAVHRLAAERGLEEEFELRSSAGLAGGINSDVDLQASWLIDAFEGGVAVAFGADQAVADGFHYAVRPSIAEALDHVRAVWDKRPTFVSYGAAADATVERLRWRGRLAFTNGVFDLLHAGHLRSLEHTRRLGAALVVGLNSDVSARALRPAGRPLIGQFQRAELLAGLRCVDAVILFEETDPLRLIEAVRPDVLVKGGTYAEAEVAGGGMVQAFGGEIALSPVLKGASTSDIVRRIIDRAGSNRP